jgi:tetratricopeptide (TPR) repeat protein
MAQARPFVLLAALALGCTAPRDGLAPVPQDLPASQLFDDAELLFRAREYGRALEAYQLVAHEAERQGDRPITVQACAMAARCYSLAGDLAKGQMWLERAQDRANVAEPRGWARTQLVGGIYQRERGDRLAALDTFAQLYDYCRIEALNSEAIDAAHHAALVAPLEAQVSWAHQGLAAARAAGDERWQAILWNNLGSTLEEQGRFEEMLEAYQQARVFHRRTGGPRQSLIADWAVGRALRRLGRTEEAWTLMADALVRADGLQVASPGPASLEWVGYVHWELGELASLRDDRDLARHHLSRALDVLMEAGVQEVWPEGVNGLRVRLVELQ